MDTVIKYTAPEVPPMENYTPQGLLEELGRVNISKNAIDKVEKILKERMRTLLAGATELRSDNFTMTDKGQDRTALDQTKAKEKLLELGGQEALDECMVTTSPRTMRINAL